MSLFRIFLASFILLFCSPISYSQTKNTRENIAFAFEGGPYISFLGNNRNFLLNFRSYIIFKNIWYTGCFYEEKYNKTEVNNAKNPKFNSGNLNYKNGGFIFGYNKFLYLKNNSNLRLNPKISFGCGRLFIVNPKNDNKLFDRINYILIITPSFGVDWFTNKRLPKPLRSFDGKRSGRWIGFEFNSNISLFNNVYFKDFPSSFSLPGFSIHIGFLLPYLLFKKIGIGDAPGGTPFKN